MHRYLSDCVGWPRGKVDHLNEMIDDAMDVTRRTFLKHVDRDELAALEAYLGYTRDFHMASDWHVSYHRSKLCGFTVYYFRQSAIEYVFIPPDFTWEPREYTPPLDEHETVLDPYYID